MKVFFGFFLHKKSTILPPPNLYKLYTLNSTLYLGVPAKPSGFPLYLCSLFVFSSLKKIRCLLTVVCCLKMLAKDAAPIPNALR